MIDLSIKTNIPINNILFMFLFNIVTSILPDSCIFQLSFLPQVLSVLDWYSKIPKETPGLIFFKGPFRGAFFRGAYIRGNLLMLLYMEGFIFGILRYFLFLW